MAGFFGPGGLGSASLTGRSEPGLDPQLMQALIAQFPGLEGLRQPQGGQQEPRSLGSLGYQYGGPTLFQGQGQNAFTLSPFEGVSGTSPESITAGLAQGTFGRSASISPLGTPSQTSQSSLLSLPSLLLPQAQVAAQQGGFGGGETIGGDAGTQDPGITISAGDVIGGAQQAADIFSPGTGTAFDPTGQTQTPGFRDYRQGERESFGGRDLSTLGGSFLQSLGSITPSQTYLDVVGQPGSDLSSGLFSEWAGPSGPSSATSPTSFAPGGSAQQALGPQAPQGDLLGGGLSTLQGLLSLYGGAQSGDIGSILGGASGTLGGISQMAPETIAALSQQLGLGAQGLGLAGAGLGGLAGGYGLYQGIEQGDPLQAVMGAGGLYAGAAPIVNALAGSTVLPSVTGMLSGAATSALAGTALGNMLGISALPAVGAVVPGAAAAGSGAIGAGTGAALGSVGGAAGGAAGSGVGAGATAAPAASAALGPIAMAMGPYIVGKLFEMGVEMTEGKEQAARTGDQYSKLMGDLPNQINMFQGAPSFLSQLGPDTTPEQAAQIFQDLGAMQDRFGGSGMENFLRQGQTQSLYGDFAKGIAAKFPESQNINTALQPLLGAMDLGRIRAQDIAQAGGLTDPGFFTPEQAANMLGKELYSSSEAGSPGAWSTRAANPWVQQNFYDPQTQATQSRQQSIDDFYNTVQQQWNEAGMGYRDPRTDLETQQRAMEMFPELGGQGALAGPGWSPAAQQAFAGIQPGGIEQGLSQLFGGQFSPTVQPWLDVRQQGQQAAQADPMLQQLQQYQQQLGQLTQQAPQILQGLQTSAQGAQLPPEMMAALGGGAPMGDPSGGGIDLEKLLRELGYLV